MTLKIGRKHIDKIAVGNFGSPVGNINKVNRLHVGHFRTWSIRDMKGVVHADRVESQLLSDAEEPFPQYPVEFGSA